VERVVRAAAVTPLPKAPEVVMGVLDLQGRVLPVIDLRRRFRLPLRALRTGDQFVVCRAGRLTVALSVDGTESVEELSAEGAVPPEEIAPGLEFLAGVTRTASGLVLIQDLERLLYPDEEQAVIGALQGVVD
jgi:purine-binding chemotaxis protein CheW